MIRCDCSLQMARGRRTRENRKKDESDNPLRIGTEPEGSVNLVTLAGACDVTAPGQYLVSRFRTVDLEQRLATLRSAVA